MMRAFVERCFRAFFWLLSYLLQLLFRFFGDVVGKFGFGRVACLWHATLSTMKSSAPLRGCFLWGSVFPVMAMLSLHHKH